jgi:rRNA maturation protein Nop10
MGFSKSNNLYENSLNKRMLKEGVTTMKTIAEECPKCGGKELGEGEQHNYAAISPKNKMSFGSPVRHIICTHCGYIIESYVTKPAKFKGTIF